MGGRLLSLGGLSIVRRSRTIVRDMRTARGQVIDWLFPRVRKRVLSLLLARPGQRWHLRDVARQTACSLAAVRRELKGLAACGVVTETRDGNRTYFQANRLCPVHGELAALLRKTSGLADVLREALAALGEAVRVAFVYGSEARRQARPGSDVDVMIIGSAAFADAVSALAGAEEALGREVNPTVYGPEEFARKAHGRHHFVRSVLDGEKLFVVGGPDELERLAKERVAADTHAQP